MIMFGQACQYGSSADASELCAFYRGNDFSIDKNAEIALDKILAVTGMSKRFVLKECNEISNCVAISYNGIRYILYDKSFMEEIAKSTSSWSSLSIFAHEIGHHVNGHSLDLLIYAAEVVNAPSLAESRQMELEADEFSGFVMYKLGASLFQSQEAITLISTNKDDNYSTHPSKDKRLSAIAKGYNKAKMPNSNIAYSSGSSTLTADDYFYNTVNIDSDYQFEIDNYSRCLSLNPNYTAAYINRGVAYHNLGKDNEAIADYTRAIKLDPNFVEAFLNRGVSYYTLKNYNNAIIDYTRAIKLDPNYAEAYLDKGASYQKLGNYKEAIVNYTRAIKLDPNLVEAYYNRGSLIQQSKNYFDAIADFTSAIKIDPNYTSAYINRGVSYHMLARYNEAIADYTNAIKIDPDKAVSYGNRGLSKKSAGLLYCSDYKKACELGLEQYCNEMCK